MLTFLSRLSSGIVDDYRKEIESAMAEEGGRGEGPLTRLDIPTPFPQKVCFFTPRKCKKMINIKNSTKSTPHPIFSSFTLCETVFLPGGGTIGFLGDKERLNVAMTRAKSSLILLGNLGTLQVGINVWQIFEFLTWSRFLFFTYIHLI